MIKEQNLSIEYQLLYDRQGPAKVSTMAFAWVRWNRRAAWLLVLAGLLVKAAGQEGQGCGEFTNSEFVRVEGRFFMVGCERYFPRGYNSWWFMKFPFNSVETMSYAQTIGLNTVRMHSFHDGPGYKSLQPQPGVYDEAVFRDLDYILFQASQYGHRVILTLVNYWEGFGGMDAYVEWSPDASVREDFYTDSLLKQYYKNHIVQMTNRVNSYTGVMYKNDPSIFAWQLINEGRAPEKGPFVLQAWIEEMSAFLKSQDPNHMVNGGTEGFFSNAMPASAPYVQYNSIPSYFGNQGVDYLANHMPSTIDFATFHIFADSWAPETWTCDVPPGCSSWTEEQKLEWTENWTAIHIQLAMEELGKPVMITEMGKWPFWGMEYRETFYSQIYNDSLSAEMGIWPCKSTALPQALQINPQCNTLAAEPLANPGSCPSQPAPDFGVYGAISVGTTFWELRTPGTCQIISCELENDRYGVATWAAEHQKTVGIIEQMSSDLSTLEECLLLASEQSQPPPSPPPPLPPPSPPPPPSPSPPAPPSPPPSPPSPSPPSLSMQPSPPPYLRECVEESSYSSCEKLCCSILSSIVVFANGVFGGKFAEQGTSSSFSLISIETTASGSLSAELLGSGALSFSANPPIIHPQAGNPDMDPKIVLQFKIRSSDLSKAGVSVHDQTSNTFGFLTTNLASIIFSNGIEGPLDANTFYEVEFDNLPLTVAGIFFVNMGVVNLDIDVNDVNIIYKVKPGSSPAPSGGESEIIESIVVLDETGSLGSIFSDAGVVVWNSGVPLVFQGSLAFFLTSSGGFSMQAAEPISHPIMTMTESFLPKTYVRFYLQIGSASVGFPSFSFSVKTTSSAPQSITIVPSIEAYLFEEVNGNQISTSVFYEIFVEVPTNLEELIWMNTSPLPIFFSLRNITIEHYQVPNPDFDGGIPDVPGDSDSLLLTPEILVCLEKPECNLITPKNESFCEKSVDDDGNEFIVLKGTSECDCIMADASVPAVIYGYSGADVLVGTNLNDFIYGGNGNDEVFGRKGKDRIWGGKGKDTLSGGFGADVIRGGKGNDILMGGPGTDNMIDKQGFNKFVGCEDIDKIVMGENGKIITLC